jgi:hypothetical protein
MPEISSQISGGERRACSAMRMADAPDASDGISDRRGVPPLYLTFKFFME